jgi:hypothetical protein
MNIKSKVWRISVITLFLLLSFKLYSQKFGMGLSVMYNFQTESFGTSIRGEFIRNQISIVPQITYYPSFNKITELYLGASLHVNVVSYGNLTMYAIANGSYNGWINYENSVMDNAKFSNWGAEAGIGIKKGKCLRPFMELRYNVKWKEANLRLGLMYFFNCSKKGHHKKKAVSCPAYSN